MTSDDKLQLIYNRIINDCENNQFTNKGWLPIYSASQNSKIVIIGQAPGFKAQESQIPWNDLSGNKLRDWLGVSKEEFYDVDNFAILPMDFYFPGKEKKHDLPPRKTFAPKWHPIILNELKQVKLIILIGSYAQKYYIKDTIKKNLTNTVKSYHDYLPTYFVLVHPSPLNRGWHKVNPWFEKEIVPILQSIVKSIINQ